MRKIKRTTDDRERERGTKEEREKETEKVRERVKDKYRQIYIKKE